MAPLIEGAERRSVRIETADAGALDVHMWELGEGPPVLMLHGWPQHAGCWRYVAPLLAERHRVLCPDLRGFGFSDAPGRGYDPETFAADAAALLDALEIERSFLVGHDWGGYTGFLLCFDQPQRIEAFVALNAPVPWLRPSPRLLAEAWRSWYAVLMAVAGEQLLPRRPDLMASGMRRDVVHGERFSEADARAYAELLARPASAHATKLLYRSYLRALAASFRGPAPPRLSVPTRLLFGAGDALLSPLTAQGHEGHADDMAVELVEDSGHFICEERPELVAERALALFGGVREHG